MYDSHATAKKLAELDADMRREQGFHRAVSARFRFYEEAVRVFAIRRLNSLGGMVARSRLSERSLDVIFEDHRYNDAVLLKIVITADRDPEFKAALIEQEGAACLAYWRKRTPNDLFGYPVAA